ncbi:hypothetical protein Tco_0335778 [Tanacetum coccineum]
MNTSQDIKMQMVDDNSWKSGRQKVVQYDGMRLGKNEYWNGEKNVVTALAEGNLIGIKWNSDKVLQLSRRGSLCQQLHSKAKEMCCLSSATTADCSRGRSRDLKHSRGIKHPYLELRSDKCSVYDSD